jgi:superfamily I DNA and/or RNA helicase
MVLLLLSTWNTTVVYTRITHALKNIKICIFNIFTKYNLNTDKKNLSSEHLFVLLYNQDDNLKKYFNNFPNSFNIYTFSCYKKKKLNEYL